MEDWWGGSGVVLGAATVLGYWGTGGGCACVHLHQFLHKAWFSLWLTHGRSSMNLRLSQSNAAYNAIQSERGSFVMPFYEI